MWTLLWARPDGAERWERYDTAEEVAEEIIKILAEYNQHAKEHNQDYTYTSSDLEEIVLIFPSSAEPVSVMEIEAHCSEDWCKENAYPF